METERLQYNVHGAAKQLGVEPYITAHGGKCVKCPKIVFSEVITIKSNLTSHS